MIIVKEKGVQIPLSGVKGGYDKKKKKRDSECALGGGNVVKVKKGRLK